MTVRDANGRIVNAMSVDVEEHFQVGAFEHTVSRDDWPAMESRVEANTRRCLDLFESEGVSATFFTLAWVAERAPGLMREIVSRGHELASHGYAHDRVHSFSPEEFRADIRKARAIIEDVSGAKVAGYRAPSFSIGKDNRWALDILAEEGYLYSSSVAPIQSDHYGWPDAPRFTFQPVDGADMIEIPVSTVEVAGKRFASGGGGYFRLLPYSAFAWAIRRLNRQEGRSAMFYFHPWEVDPDQPRFDDAPLKSRFRHYTNLDRMEGKLRQVLRDFSWDRVDRVFLPDRQSISQAA